MKTLRVNLLISVLNIGGTQDSNQGLECFLSLALA